MAKKYLKHFIFSIPLVILWVFIAYMIFTLQKQGIISVLQDAFGYFYLYLMIILASISIILVISLPLILRSELKIQLILYVLTAIFCSCIFIGINVGESKFKHFSVETWNKYPSRRITMYDDLKSSYGLINFEKDEIISLLGEPERIFQEECFVYDARYGNAVYVEFENGKCIDVYIIE